MKLTGLQIFKMLPNKNCKECGFQTCLAFAMKLAAGQANLDDCPYISDEVREKLGAAAAPPIRPVRIGAGEHEVRVGEELVLFRHEKMFYHPVAYALHDGCNRLFAGHPKIRLWDSVDYVKERIRG